LAASRWPKNTASMPLAGKSATASAGRWTIGSPRRLKLVVVMYWKDGRHPPASRFLGLLEETARREGWLGFDPDRDWLPDADRADLRAWTAAASG
jgi:hypothetical protein